MKRSLLAAAIAALTAQGCGDSAPPGTPDVVPSTDVASQVDRTAPADGGGPPDVATAFDVVTPPPDVVTTPPDAQVSPVDAPLPPQDVGTSPRDVPPAPVDAGPPAPDASPPVVGAACARDGDCIFDSVGETCDPSLGRCVECVDGAGCGFGSFCNARRQCAPGCGSHDDCSRSQYCAADNTCQSGCRDDSSCGFSAPRCDLTTRRCFECASDAQCGAGRVCRSGGCTTGCSAASPCAAGQTCCDGLCRNLQTDAVACGACTTRCAAPAGGTATCAGGVCGSACMTGLANCDGNAGNGCETDTRGSVMHCGACNAACPTPAGGTAACNNGRCGVACAAGRADCDGMASNGCETTLDTAANCGMCGRACSFANATGACTAGACAVAACNAGFANCDGSGANGCEVDTRANTAHCGACNRACAFANAAATCAGGACTMGACNPGFANCDGDAANGCETDTRGSSAHCGACGNACPVTDGRQLCIAGSCAVRTCLAVRTALPSSPDGRYRLDLDGAGPSPARTYYCDMTGGGWTLVANQVPASLLPDQQTTVNEAGFGDVAQSWRLGAAEIRTLVPALAWRLQDPGNAVYFRPTCAVDWARNFTGQTTPDVCTTGYTSTAFTAAVNGGWIDNTVRGIGVNNRGANCSMRMMEGGFGINPGSAPNGPAYNCVYSTATRVSLAFQ